MVGWMAVSWIHKRHVVVPHQNLLHLLHSWRKLYRETMEEVDVHSILGSKVATISTGAFVLNCSHKLFFSILRRQISWSCSYILTKKGGWMNEDHKEGRRERKKRWEMTDIRRNNSCAIAWEFTFNFLENCCQSFSKIFSSNYRLMKQHIWSLEMVAF